MILIKRCTPREHDDEPKNIGIYDNIDKLRKDVLNLVLTNTIEWCIDEKTLYDNMNTNNYGKTIDEIKNEIMNITPENIHNNPFLCIQSFELNKLILRVYISGEVKYGDATYRVASGATLLEKGKKKSYVSIDMVDGDSNVCLYVNNDIIMEV